MVNVNEPPLSPRLNMAVIYLGLLTPLGYLGVTSLPFWLSAAIQDGLLPAKLAGLLAASEMLAMAIANILTSSFLVGGSIRTLVRAGAVGAIAGSFLCMAPHLMPLVAGRLLCGGGFGILNAAIAASAARQSNPQRSLAVILLMMMPVLALAALVTPHLISWGGIRAVFGTIAILCAAGWILARQVPGREEGAATTPGGTRSFSPVAVAACLAIAAYSAAQYVILPFLVVIAANSQIAATTVGLMVSLSVLFTLPAPALASALGERTGLTVPIVSSLLGMALGAILLLGSTNITSFAAGMLLTYFAPSFLLPYAFGLLARLDARGRYASTFPGFLMVGAAAGPALASQLAAAAEFGRMTLLALGLLAASLLLFITALRASARSPNAPVQNGHP